MAATAYLVLFVTLVTAHAVFGRQMRSVPTAIKTCPSDWDPSPCSCGVIPADRVNSSDRITSSDQLAVNCNNVTSGEEIKLAFSKFKDFVAVHWLLIKDSPLTSLPSGIFGKASFIVLAIYNTNLSTVADDSFKGSENTASMVLLDSNNFESFNFKSLHPLLNLSWFILTKDKLRAIPDEAFGDNKPQLVGVAFPKNRIATLGKGIFNNLPNLEGIDVSHNYLMELNESAFSANATKNHIIVDLSHNQISKIHKDAFKNTKFQQIKLNDNKMDEMDPEIFKPIVDSIFKNNGSLSIKGNPFDCNKTNTGWISDLPNEERRIIQGYNCQNETALKQMESDQLP